MSYHLATTSNDVKCALLGPGLGTPLPGSASSLLHISRAAAVNYLPSPFLFSYCNPSFLYLISFVALSLFVDQFLHFIPSLTSLPPVSFMFFPFLCHLFCLTCIIFPLLYFSHRIIFLPLGRLFLSFFRYSSLIFFAVFPYQLHSTSSFPVFTYFSSVLYFCFSST